MTKEAWAVLEAAIAKAHVALKKGQKPPLEARNIFNSSQYFEDAVCLREGPLAQLVAEQHLEDLNCIINYLEAVPRSLLESG